MAHREGRRDAWKQLVEANSLEFRVEGLIGSLPCVLGSSVFKEEGGEGVSTVLPAFLIWAVLIPENLASRIETTLTCCRDKWETLGARGTGPDCH